MKTAILALSTLIGGITWWAALCPAAENDTPLTYRHFNVEEAEGRVISMTPVPEKSLPLWAREVSQKTSDWRTKPDADKPFFAQPIPFVIPPSDAGEPFHRHNHQPSITWLPNGDLLAIWYSTESESGTEMTVLASRLRMRKRCLGSVQRVLQSPEPQHARVEHLSRRSGNHLSLQRHGARWW